MLKVPVFCDSLKIKEIDSHTGCGRINGFICATRLNLRACKVFQPDTETVDRMDLQDDPTEWEGRRNKAFQLKQGMRVCRGALLPVGQSMGWGAPFLAPAYVNIIETKEKGVKQRSESVFKSEWVALAQ